MTFALWELVAVALLAFIVGFGWATYMASGHISRMGDQIVALHGRMTDMVLSQSRRKK